MKKTNPALKGKKHKPQSKTMESMLRYFIKKNMPQFSGEIVLNSLVHSLIKVIDTYYKDASHLTPGEAFMIGVDKDERPGFQKSLLDTKLKTCIVPLFTDEDVENKNNGMKAREIKKKKIKRIILNAIEQNVVFSNQDLAHIMNLSPSTISKYIREIEEDENILLPRRGTIHDLGPSITHKVYILKKIKLDLKTVEQTCRETHHSKEAINRYLKDFENIEFLYEKGFSIDDIHKSTKKSFKLIKEYIDIIDKFMEVKKNA